MGGYSMSTLGRLSLLIILVTLVWWPALADRSPTSTSRQASTKRAGQLPNVSRQASKKQTGRLPNAASVAGGESLGTPGISIAQGTALASDGVGLFSQP